MYILFTYYLHIYFSYQLVINQNNYIFSINNFETSKIFNNLINIKKYISETDLGFLQKFGIVMAKADADELSYFFDTSIPDQSVQEILSESVSNRLREITSTAPTDVINTFSTFLKNPKTLPSGDAGEAGDLAGHILLATKAAIDTVEYNLTNQQHGVINFDLVLKRVENLSLDDELDIFLSKIVKINETAREAFKSLVSTL